MKKILLLLLLVVTPCLALAQSQEKFIDPLQPAHYQPQPQVEVQSHSEQIDALRHQFQLTAILKSDQRAMAVINGRPMQVNQTIADFRLIKIGFDYVVLRKGKQTLTLYRAISGMMKSPAHRSDSQ